MMEDEYPPDYIKENFEVFDRFMFDHLFKRLVGDGYDHEDAKDIILYNCALSTLVMQERLYNGFYLKISVSDTISPDLLDLQREFFNKAFNNNN